MKGWKVWVEPSGRKSRCRWSGKYGTGQETFDYKADAKEYAGWKRRNCQRLDAGLAPLPPESRPAPDFDKFTATYLAHVEQRRSRVTVVNSRRAFSLYKEFSSSGFPVTPKMQGDFGGKTVAEFSDWLMSRKTRQAHGERANGVRIVLRTFKASLRWAQKQGIIEYDPFLHFEMPAAVQVARMVAPETVIAILKELPDIARRALYFNLHVGLRISELVRADWSGVERAGDKWYLTVVKSKTRRGKREETKTQRLHAFAIRVMGEPGTGPIFPVKKEWLQHKLREAVIKLGLGRVRWHDIRHTWATNMMEQVRDLRATMDAGGWVTEHAAMIYQHSTKKRIEATAEVDSQVPPDHAL